MLRRLKLAALQTAKNVGIYSLVGRSRWRTRRLLILCYHGISLQDEHCWSPDLYISREIFEQRLDAIRDAKATVLPLGVGISALYADQLPDRAICMTFDDGFHDFFAVAYPLLQKYRCPATVYLTSYYSQHPRPIFDLMCSYLLWKGRDRTITLDWPAPQPKQFDLTQPASRQALVSEIRKHAYREDYSAEAKDELLGLLAAELGLDYAAICASRVLQIMSANELRQIDGSLVTLALHTHRHRVPLEQGLFSREIDENVDFVEAALGGQMMSRHFCYPSGVTSPAFLPWLKACGVTSATTCAFGLASRTDDPLLLPRFLDSQSVSSIEFEGWLTGAASRLPRRAYTASPPTTDGVLVDAPAGTRMPERA